MPRMDGWASSHELRVRKMDLPVIVMTAALDEEPERWATEVQAVDVLAKPFGIAELLHAVARWTTGSGASETAPAPGWLPTRGERFG